MADGLLSSALGAIDRTKQALGARFGLLADNPEEFARQLAAETRARTGAGLIGEPKTAEEMASGKWINTPYGKQAIQAFSIAAPIAYHGSPYIFDKFDISKVGTGEGSQAYGHGMYYAEYEPTAKQFASIASSPGFRQGSAFGNEQSKLDAQIILSAKQFTDGNVQQLSDLIKRRPLAFRDPEKMLGRINEYIDNAPPKYLYKVDIPDNIAKTFLDWNSQINVNPQSEKALQKINKKYGFGYDNSYTGGDLYKALTTDFIRTNRASNQKEAQKLVSKELSSMGIKGVQHIDPNAPEFKNYVVFDPSVVKVLERNNKPLKGLLK
jgi:hypothetical protein